jgi:hypothetical protein
MSEAGDPGADVRLSHRRATRVVLSFLLLLHWGSVAAFLLPVDPDSIADVPTPIRVPLEAVAVPIAYRSWPVARAWLDATSTRQHWTLFAPDPADWSAQVEVVAYYLVSDAGEPIRWQADTITLPGPASDPLPHWTEHRPFRIVFNLGFDVWGRFYRPVLARRFCRERVLEGRRPAGIDLASDWTPLDPPWRDSVRAVERQRLGGFSCWELLGEPRPAALAPMSAAGPRGERP